MALSSEQYAKLLDLKSIGRPPRFTGKESDWADFRYRFKVSMSLLLLRDTLDVAANSLEPIDFVSLNDEAKHKTTVLHAILVQQVDGKALSIIKLIREPNGLEMWRLLCKEYEPDSRIRESRMLVGVLSPSFSNTLDKFSTEMLDWQYKVQRYEAASKKPLDDQIKIATIIGHAPECLQPFLTFQNTDWQTFDDLKHHIMRYISRQIKFDSQGRIDGTGHQNPNGRSDDPMDVDAIKGKGKGKGKGGKGQPPKGKGKGSSGNFGGNYKGGWRPQSWSNDWQPFNANGNNQGHQPYNQWGNQNGQDNQKGSKGSGKFGNQKGKFKGNWNNNQWPKGKGKGSWNSGKGKGYVSDINDGQWSDQWSQWNWDYNGSQDDQSANQNQNTQRRVTFQDQNDQSSGSASSSQNVNNPGGVGSIERGATSPPLGVQTLGTQVRGQTSSVNSRPFVMTVTVSEKAVDVN